MDSAKVLMKTSLAYDGVAAVTINYYKNMPKNRITMDFAVCEADDFRDDFVEYIKSHGSKIISLPKPHKHIFLYSREMRKCLKNGAYNIIHINGNSGNMFIDVLLAKLCGIKIIITHCHNTNCRFKLLHYLFKPFLNIMTSDRFACSNPAGRWLYNNNSFKIVQNGINFSNYKYCNESRNYIRQRYGLTDELVLCHVGSFYDVKNHSYLIDIFNEVTRINPKSVLLLIGTGALFNDIKDKVTKLGLQNKVIFAGNTTEIEKYYSAADIFVLPSKFEGLPLVLIEAQVSGLPCVIADNITTEVDITGMITALSIDCKPKVWAEKILATVPTMSRDDIEFNEKAVLFDIKENALEMEQFYIDRTNAVYKSNE
jgi:glycosyltransferase involved in cell wall biosynthesis